MPYNTAAIPPRRDATGTVQLPLSRVKKIVGQDNDINMCSNNAAFVITLACESFIQHLAEQGHNVVKSERKPRRNIQYRDLANAVARNDNLEFLADVVPRTVPFKEVKEKKAPTGPAKAANGEASMEHGQTTLDVGGPMSMNGMNGLNGADHDGAAHDGDDSTIADPNQQLEMEIRGARISTGSIGEVINGQDVEMGQ
ncbi:transcription factor [Hyphodiscus hymeniophilus]|uniref:Transcription factor n=1 Tax=Hyphodiscus hymeniophilus TaxID=353542 RepID=A0A9P6VS16_9HELO|nr:transcription factor [Hyphodiscus hymeniophilus]